MIMAFMKQDSTFKVQLFQKAQNLLFSHLYFEQVQKFWPSKAQFHLFDI